ncbi:galactose-specific lectin nattectin-like [Haliotis rufescens]|uniref:galactose-specific lectin nattectin-like n=1 Tax=Haliotis rufescens TaxID=6454 RepID=UPI001EB07670|nr:galactose-specific lectin nattectin-like [Haliotis rufescens]
MEAKMNIVFFLMFFVQAYCFNVRCPSGFIANGAKCYKFVNWQASWPEAKVMCDVMDAHLLEIDSPWEEQFILERLDFVENEISDGSLWIGATDIINENEWVWMTSGKRVGYRNWNREEPEAMMKVHGHCLAVTPKPKFIWEEIPCKQELFFICEMNMD